MSYDYIITHTAMAKMTWWTSKAIQTAFDDIDVNKDACDIAIRRIVHDAVNDVYFRVTLLANGNRYVQLWHSATPVDADDARYPIIEVAG